MYWRLKLKIINEQKEPAICPCKFVKSRHSVTALGFSGKLRREVYLCPLDVSIFKITKQDFLK